jgi:transcriptional regulator with XRE-family HTH domain
VSGFPVKWGRLSGFSGTISGVPSAKASDLRTLHGRLAHVVEKASKATKGQSRKALAGDLDKSVQTVSDWTTGKTEPSMAMVARLCRRARVPADWLLGVGEQPAVPAELAAQAIGLLNKALALLIVTEPQAEDGEAEERAELKALEADLAGREKASKRPKGRGSKR